MNNDSTENLSSILQTADYVNGELFTANHMPDEVLSGDFFDEVKEVMSVRYCDLSNNRKLLDTELRSQFMSYTESRLQDRFANYLIYLIKDKLRPVYDQVSSIREDFEHQPYGEGHPFESAGYLLFWNAERVLYAWISNRLSGSPVLWTGRQFIATPSAHEQPIREPP